MFLPSGIVFPRLSPPDFQALLPLFYTGLSLISDGVPAEIFAILRRHPTFTVTLLQSRRPRHGIGPPLVFHS